MRLSAGLKWGFSFFMTLVLYSLLSTNVSGSPGDQISIKTLLSDSGYEIYEACLSEDDEGFCWQRSIEAQVRGDELSGYLVGSFDNDLQLSDSIYRRERMWGEQAVGGFGFQDGSRQEEVSSNGVPAHILTQQLAVAMRTQILIIEIDEHEELTLYEVDGRHGELQIDLVYRGEIEKLSVGLMQFYLENSAVRLLLTPGHVQAVRSPAGQTEVREEKGERERAGLQATAVLFEPLISFNAGGIGLPFIRHPLLPPIDNLYAGRKGGLNKQLEEVRLEKSREYKRAAKQKRISRWQKIAGGSVFLGSVALGVFWEWAALRDQWIIPGMEKGRDVVMTLKEKGGEYGRYVFELPGVQSITSLVEDRVGEASKIFERYWQDGKRVLDQGITYLFPRGCGQRGFSVFKQDGHFVSYGAVNGRRFDKLMVDTGATLVAISAEVARKSGLDYYREIGDEGQCKTANGNSVCYRLDNIPVSLGCLPVRRVGVSVIEGMQGDEVLLGMSYLTQFFFASDGTVLNIKNQ